MGCRGIDGPVVRDLAQVVPSEGLPSEVVVQDGNNNLDIVWHRGRLYLAFRSAPDHFASDQVVMWVVSTTDEVDWRYEGHFDLDTDLREPQLVSWQGELRLYFAVLGTDPLDFEPQGARVARWLGPGEWTEPEPIWEPTFIPWRIKPVDGELTLVGYTGGANVYDLDGDPIEVHWLASDDGLDWRPMVPGQPVMLSGGGSEVDWVRLDDDSVLAVVRNEAGDELGFGSKICLAPPEEPGRWECVGDPRKYDSPLLLQEGEDVWLVARRNLTDDGHYDLGRDDLDPHDQYLHYQLDYWSQPKRCALWRVDPDTLSVEHALDLPSRGDTCFPEAAPHGERSVLLYNYSSPVDGPELSWLEGQTGPTGIYRMVVELP